jgi:hypothetical protein
MGWALRLGSRLTVLGAATGVLMITPTSEQLNRARATHEMPISGAHAVGAPDGEPGMPGTGWSREHGDLPVPHIIGLHAIQFLPLFAWLVARSRSALVIAVGTGYTAVSAFLLLQALAGRPFLSGLR